MWLFVTTAARYADAVPWEFLRAAVTRGTAVAVVLDRVPPEATEEVRSHLASMLTEHGLGDAPLFVVPETSAYDAMLPPDVIDPIRSWLHGIAGDPDVRGAVVRHTLDGAVRSLARPGVRARVRRRRAGRGGGAAAARGRLGVRRGAGARRRGQRRRIAAARRGARALAGVRRHRRDDARPGVQGVAGARPGDGRGARASRRPGSDLAEALESGVEALVRSSADTAAEKAGTAWAADPAGAELLGDDDLRRSSPELAEATQRAVREWQADVLELVRTQGQSKRTTARYMAFGVNGLGLMLMIVVFAHTGGPGGGRGGGGRRRVRAEPEDPRGGARRPGRAVARRAGPRRTCTAGWPSCSRPSGAGSPTGSARPASTTAPAPRCAPPSRTSRTRDEFPHEITRCARDFAGRMRRRGRHRRADLPGMLAALDEAVEALDGRVDGPRAARPGAHRLDPGGGAAAAVGGAHRGGARRVDRQRQVVAVQRPVRRRRLAGRRPAPDDVEGATPASGGRRARRRWSSGSACRAGRPPGGTGRGCATRSVGELDGLVLLDLPDHDSTVVEHQHEVDRLVELVDLLVWVVDPQKYADQVLHERYLRRLAGHESVIVVVLNQVDTVNPFAAAECAEDLRRLLDDDGLRRSPVLTSSARTGAGHRRAAGPAGRRGLVAPRAQRPAGRRHRGGRRVADARRLGRRALGRGLGGARPAGRGAVGLAGVPGHRLGGRGVLAAARRRAARLAADPLGPAAATGPAAPPAPQGRGQEDGALGAGALVGPRAHAGAARAGRHRAAEDVRRGGRRPARAVAAGRPGGGGRARVGRARPAGPGRRQHRPRCRPGAAVVAGAARRCSGCSPRRRCSARCGCSALAFGSYLRLPDPPTPDVGGFAVPTLLLVGGVAARAAARAGRPADACRAAPRRGESGPSRGCGRRSRRSPTSSMLQPVEAELERHARARVALDRARTG